MRTLTSAITAAVLACAHGPGSEVRIKGTATPSNCHILNLLSRRG